MRSPISVMVSHDNVTGTAFEFRTIEPTPQAMQSIIECEYFNAVPGGDWAVYLGEAKYKHQQVTENRAAMRLVDGLAPGRRSVPMVGRCVFVGTNGSVETDVPDHLIHLALAQVPTPIDRTISLFRHREHIFVYDDQARAVIDLLSSVDRHRTARDLDPIESFFGISPTAWVELRVEIMDDWAVQLHDHRNDRSYG